MNETEWWLSCTDPTQLLEALRTSGKASGRKLRLFAAACVRPHWGLLVDPRSRDAVELSEQVADGVRTPEDLATAYRAAWAALPLLPDRNALVRAARATGRTVQQDAYEAGCYTTNEIVELHAELSEEDASADGEKERLYWAGKGAAQGRLACLLREIFGPLPFRSVAIAPFLLEWRDKTIVKLAQAAYDNRQLPAGTLEPERLMVLADAMEEAGARDQEILRHLREQKDHWRGCWVVDLLLDKE
jgi:hypothetical protein